MKKALSIIMILAMVLSMVPAVYADAVEPVIIASATDVTAKVAAPATYEWTAETDGTLTVTMSSSSGGWRFVISDSDGNTLGLPKKGTTELSNSFDLVAGTTYTFAATGYDSNAWDAADGIVSYTLSFVGSSDSGTGEVEKADYEISDTQLTLGDNALTLLDTAVTTIYVYEPTETGVFTFTAPEGSVLGYWGAGSWFLTNPNSTTNTYEWTCTGVGQSAYIGVSGVDGSFNLNVAKTGNYEVYERPIIPYENKANLEPFALPEGAKLHSYIDVNSETVYTAVWGEDGYYHLDSTDGDIILVDMDYQDIILSDALKSDRPVMYVYDTDENGKEVKYDIGSSIQAYEAVTDENGYYPLTDDLIYFYDNYANAAGVYTFFVLSDYNPDNVWLYCMRTVTFPEVTEPEPTEPEPTEPEPTEPEPTEPEPTEPEPTEPIITEPIVTEPSIIPECDEVIATGAGVAVDANNAVTATWTAVADGTLTVSMSKASPGWRCIIKDVAGNSIGLPKSGVAAATVEYKVTKGTSYVVTIFGWDSAEQSQVATYLSYAIGFTAAEDIGGDVELAEKEISNVALVAGDNTLTSSETAVYTLYRFRPTATGNYIFAAPEGAIVGYWGATTNYLVNPNNTSNICQWNCTGVGQSAYIGVTGVDGSFVLNITLSEIDEPDPTEPEATEPTEPEPSEPETSVPEVTEPTTEGPAGNVIYVSTSSQLSSAISTATADDTITLSGNIDLGTSTLTIASGHTVVIDLNGNTLTSKKSSGGTITVKGNLTVWDTSASKTGAIINTATSSDRGVVLNEDDAIFTLKSGSISTKTQGVRVEKGTFNCEGGTINATNYGIYTANATTANITGGYINSGFDTFNYTVYAPTGSNVTISGGYFNGSAPSGNGLTGGISGGYFARKATNTALLAPDCYYEDITGTTYLFMVVNPNAVPEDPEVPEDVKPVDSWNLVLDDDLTVNFYMNIDAADVTSAQVQVTVDDVPQTFDASGLAVTDDGKYIVSISVAAAQTMDEITVKLTGTSNECEATTYTIRQYADTVLADSSLSKYHALIKEMLNYGAAAQVYFDHNADNLANADINGVGVHEVPDASDNMFTMVNKVDGVVPYGASLVCKDKITVRFYFKVTGDINSFSFSINTEPCEAFKNGDYYCVDVADICPQDLDQQITITVADANGNSMYVSYSPMNYIVSMSANGSDNLKTLVKALYNYHLAAKQLRTS